MMFNQRGLPHHLLKGHGDNLDKFEKRDIATTCNLSYQNRQPSNEIIHPTTYHVNDPLANKIQINSQPADITGLFAGYNNKEKINPKGYNQYTKKFDNNYLKIGLR